MSLPVVLVLLGILIALTVSGLLGCFVAALGVALALLRA